MFRYKSAQPFNVITGVDNRPSTGSTATCPRACETLNSGRGADFKQLDLRVSKRFRFGGRTALELIGEGFNLTNATNPGGYVPRRTYPTLRRTRRVFAGDFQRGEQRLFQLGARFEF